MLQREFRINSGSLLLTLKIQAVLKFCSTYSWSMRSAMHRGDVIDSDLQLKQARPRISMLANALQHKYEFRRTTGIA